MIRVGYIKKYEEIGRHSQITLIIGEDLAELKTLVNYLLPKPSIDKASIRMSELLKQRYFSIPKDESPTDHFSAIMGSVEI